MKGRKTETPAVKSADALIGFRLLLNGGTTLKSRFTWLLFRCHVHVLVPLLNLWNHSVSWCLTRNGRISWGKLHTQKKKKRRKFIKMKSWSEIHWSKSCKWCLTGWGSWIILLPVIYWCRCDPSRKNRLRSFTPRCLLSQTPSLRTANLRVRKDPDVHGVETENCRTR